MVPPFAKSDKKIAFLVSSNLGLKDRKIAYFNLNDPFSWLVEDASSLVPQNATLEPVFMRFPKGKAVSCETARSVMRGVLDDVRTFLMENIVQFEYATIAK